MAGRSGKSRSEARAVQLAPGVAGSSRRVSRQPSPVKPETLADVGKAMAALGRQARAAAHELALASTKAKNAALMAAAGEMRAQTAAILDANARDLAAAGEGRATAAFLDRLLLDPQRIEAIAKGLEEVAACPIPSAP